ncbi:MAG: preprotein translocase subunit SecY [Bacteroidaceae bacterium]|jgi:preprotein translocase subunit SecY|nr:preprotein translocase subunit SecY [Bacteroidaceae bacterium]
MGKAIDKLKNIKLVKTISNICKIEDLRTRILITIAFVAVYRFGSYIVLPGVDTAALESLSKQTEGGLMSLLDMFSGGAFSKASIFALGIMPYISASIVMQLLGIAVPYFQKMQREGESGRRKMNQYTRYLTVGILILQAPTYLFNLYKTTNGTAIYSSIDWTMFYITSTIILAAGSMFILWLGERITDKGIGQGVSLIIMIGIIARFPQAITQEFLTRFESIGQGGLIGFLVEFVVWLAVIAAAILLVQGVRRVPVQYAKRVVGNRQYGGARQYIPLKPYAANVMPIIFAQAIMFIPITVAQFMGANQNAFMMQLLDNTSVVYNVIFAALIIIFTYLYTAITINPTQMAEDMKRNNGFIPGVKPGKSTADYLDGIMSRITFPGSLFLALIAVLPAFASLFNVQREFAQFFGGTSLLILVGVVLDTLQHIESHLLMRHYDGLLDSGRIRGAH